MNNDVWQYKYEKLGYSGFDINLSKLLLDYISSFKDNDIVLDFGGGVGRISSAVCYLKPNIHIHLHDISSIAINKAKNNLANCTNVIFSSLDFKPVYEYDRVICHRVLHNMPMRLLDLFLKDLTNSLSINNSFFISVKHKECKKYFSKLKDSNYTYNKIEHSFYSLKSKRYLRFYDIETLSNMLDNYNIFVKDYGLFEEPSFRNNENNLYLYCRCYYSVN